MNVSIEVIDTTKEERDIAIVLNSVGYLDDYEGDFTQRRTLLWTLNFTVKTYLFGPVPLSVISARFNWTTAPISRLAPRNSAIVPRLNHRRSPPFPATRLTPTDNYKVVETYEDIYSSDNDFFGLG